MKPGTVARRFNRRWRWTAAIAVLALLIVADRAGFLLSRHNDDVQRYHGAQVTVSRVVSAHTLEVDIEDTMSRRTSTQVRLVGVTAPLPAARNREAQPLWKEAAALTRDIVQGKSVVLVLQPQRTRDSFGRLLAHVEIPEGGTLNESLLEAGLAQVDERWPHAMLVRYAQAQATAQRYGRGMWRE